MNVNAKRLFYQLMYSTFKKKQNEAHGMQHLRPKTSKHVNMFGNFKLLYNTYTSTHRTTVCHYISLPVNYPV